MKAFLRILVFSFILLAGCSGEVDIELVNATADIERDTPRVIGEGTGNDGTKVKPTVLVYDLTFRNIGRPIKSSDRFQYKIEPKGELKEELMDIINMSSFNDAISNHYGFITPIRKKERGTAYIYYSLGEYEEDSEVPVFKPIKDLKSIKEKAMEADLVLLLNGEEFKRISLSDYK